MNTKRNIVIIVCIIAAAACGWFLLNNPKAAPTSTVATTTLTFSGAGMTFSYPPELTAYQQDDTVVLHHEIPYENYGGCNMMEEGTLYDKLTDFNLTMRIINFPLVQTVKSISPYIPEENFDGDILKVNPGFIDSFEVGVYKGFVIYEGAEGCGVITHYFPLSATKTLVAQRAAIQALNPGIYRPEEIREVLAVPGAIATSVSDRMFKDILTSLTIQ